MIFYGSDKDVHILNSHLKFIYKKVKRQERVCHTFFMFFLTKKTICLTNRSRSGLNSIYVFKAAVECLKLNFDDLMINVL